MTKQDAIAELKNLVLEKEKQGKVVIATIDGYMEIELDEIIKQPVEGLLYDLNRNREIILTFIDDPKWVNDFACAQVIEKLKEIVDMQGDCLAGIKCHHPHLVPDEICKVVGYEEVHD